MTKPYRAKLDMMELPHRKLLRFYEARDVDKERSSVRVELNKIVTDVMEDRRLVGCIALTTDDNRVYSSACAVIARLQAREKALRELGGEKK